MTQYVHLSCIFILILINTGRHMLNSHASAVDMVIPDDLRYDDLSIVDKNNNEAIAVGEDVSKSFNATSQPTAVEVDLSTCRAFIAPSTIPGAGMGMFAGQTFKRGDEITTGDGVVPLIDSEWNSDVESFENQFLWDEYVWSADTFPGMKEPHHHLEAASFGIGALPNCFFPLLNAGDSEADRDNAAIEVGVDPGTGAFSVFHNRRGLARKEINAGDEIFVDYGYGYFEGDREKLYGLIPFLYSYKAADILLKDFRRTSKRWENRLLAKENTNEPPTTLKIEDVPDTLYDLVKDVIMTWPSRTQGALPTSAKDVNYVLDVLGSTSYIHAQRSKRDIEWLKEHGSCLDHLVVRNSTVPHAGRGAFANKFIPKGAVVAPVPLIHIPNRTTLDLYNGYLIAYNRYETEYKRNTSDLLHRQLMLNYCFGHRESSLLLCPYGVATSLVNHGSTKNNQANAKVVWSTKITSRPEYFNMSIEEWAYKYQTGLAFDFIATRDIQEGEEVLIDYGDEWQEAWDKHLESWVPRKLQAQILNEMEPPIEIPIYTEWPWPDVSLWCRDIYRDMHGLLEAEEDAHPCRVMSKSYDNKTSEALYLVELRVRDQGNVQKVTGDGKCSEIFDEVMFFQPRDAFMFGNEIEADPQYRYYNEVWSFRHDIRIPDELMPLAWKDLAIKQKAIMKE